MKYRIPFAQGRRPRGTAGKIDFSCFRTTRQRDGEPTQALNAAQRPTRRIGAERPLAIRFHSTRLSNEIAGSKPSAGHQFRVLGSDRTFGLGTGCKSNAFFTRVEEKCSSALRTLSRSSCNARYRVARTALEIFSEVELSRFMRFPFNMLVSSKGNRFKPSLHGRPDTSVASR